MVRGAVVDHAGAVRADDHGKVLQAYVVEGAAKGALEEGRVQRDDGTNSAGREPRGEDDGF